MSIINPLILGIVTKVYDDIIDINLDVSENFIAALQSLIIMFFTLTAYNDFYFSFACCVVALLNSGFDNPFWKSLIPVAIILTIINFSVAGNNFILKIILALFAIAGILTIAVFEDRLFPEEVSIEKIVFRSLLFFGFVGTTIFLKLKIIPLPNFSFSSLAKTTTLMATNMLVSVSMMAYLLFYSGKSLKELNGIKP